MQVEVSELDNGTVPEREMVTENVRVIEPSNEVYMVVAKV